MPAVPERSLGKNVDTTNPFVVGVNYEMFLSNVTKEKTVDKLLKKHNLSDEQIEWVKRELQTYKENKK